MTSRAKQLTAMIAIGLGLLFPQQVECGYPGGECAAPGMKRQMCSAYEVEPLGFYLVEWLVGRNVGFAYSRGQTCR
ncbi:MAG TPA: hypothetical protein VNO30_23675 [Kofleriaceae bacterium]|nr:hypothetical protein [Kofleriaceae bacterium]